MSNPKKKISQRSLEELVTTAANVIRGSWSEDPDDIEEAVDDAAYLIARRRDWNDYDELYAKITKMLREELLL